MTKPEVADEDVAAFIAQWLTRLNPALSPDGLGRNPRFQVGGLTAPVLRQTRFRAPQATVDDLPATYCRDIRVGPFERAEPPSNALPLSRERARGFWNRPSLGRRRSSAAAGC